MSPVAPTDQRTEQCTVARCGNPTPDFVCRHCLEQLRTDLWAIAGHPGRRADVTAVALGLATDADDLHGLADQLLVTMSRQDVVQDPLGHHVAEPDLEPERTDEPIATTALAYKPSAGDMHRELRTTLNMWVRVLLDRRYGTQLDGLARDGAYRRRVGRGVHGPWRAGPPMPSADIADMAWWLGRHREAVALDPDGGRLVAEVGALVPRAAAAVSPRQWEYMGPCLHWHCAEGPSRCQACAADEPPPAEHLYCVRGADWVSCRPCGRSYDVVERRRWLLEQAEDQLVTAEQAADALPRYLTPELGGLLRPRRIRHWGDNGLVTVHRPHPGERALDSLGRSVAAPVRYRVGDLLDAVRRDAERGVSRRRATAGERA